MLWAVTAYFNPVGYASRRSNYLAFAAGLERQRVPLLTVELSFGERPFELPEQADVIRLRSADVMWQKERLLNLAIRQLPPECEAVAWLDSDLIFQNDRWELECRQLLERHPIVQPFEETEQYGLRILNFASAQRPDLFGQPSAAGFGWVGRRELLQRHGLYDASILGGGDNMIASAMVDRELRHGLQQPQPIPLTSEHRAHYQAWKEPFFQEVRGNLGHASGKAIHLPHGVKANRRYWDRHVWLTEQKFDPSRDITIGENHCWHWNSHKPELHAVARQYFELRREDES